jgi:hypothetical protein
VGDTERWSIREDIADDCDSRFSKTTIPPGHRGTERGAIQLVIAYHAGVPYFAGEYVGVNVFFVLSGYLITGLPVREVETTDKIDLIAFYARGARAWLRLRGGLGVVLSRPVRLTRSERRR